MTLHQATEAMKKVLLIVGALFGGILLIVFLFQLGVLLKNAIFPPKVEPPTHLYGKLPKIVFPANVTDKQLTYTINTIDGNFPTVPDRLGVFPILQPQPNFLNLDKTKNKVQRLGFYGSSLVEIPLGNANYEWREISDIQRIVVFNTITFDFILQSNYLSSSAVLNARSLPNEQGAISRVEDLLHTIDLFPSDIDLGKTQTPPQQLSYLTAPQIFEIRQGQLIPTTSLSNAQVIRVDLYQNDLAYDLNTGVLDLQGLSKHTPVTLPIFYPHPPYSTMSFWVAAGQNGSLVTAANFVHKTILSSEENQATYAIKTPTNAFKELQAGKGYIAAYDTEKKRN